MCADHTLCMVCMACSHHSNHTPALSQLHADGMWIGREGEEGGRSERKGQLTPSLHHTSSRHTSPLLPLFPPSHLPSTPTTHTHTIISIDLPDNHHITAHLTQPTSPHTHVPSLTQCMCQCTEVAQQQQPDYSRSSPPPAAHVLLHLHATPVNTSSKWYMCE